MYTQVDYIVVSDVPAASFTAGVTSGCAPLDVCFTGPPTTGSACDPTSWFWDFGDGTTSTEENPCHTYPEPGVYTVTLTVVNACGSDTVTVVDYILVDSPPSAGLSADVTSGCGPLDVQFTDESTGDPTSWLWDFGDGSLPSTEQRPLHTYVDPGTYTVTLTATNACGSDTLALQDYILVDGPLTVALAADVTSGCAPLDVCFTDLSTGDPTSWLWDFGDGTTSTEQNPCHTYLDSAVYTVTLTVENGCASDALTKPDYIVVNGPPVAGFTADATSGCAPLAVLFTDESTGAPTSWLWDFGDGTASSAQHPQHTYAEPGVYTVTLTVVNACGSDTVTVVDYILVIGPPEPVFSADVTRGCAPLTVCFTDQSPSDPWNAPTSWLWNFGDGSPPSTEQDPCHVYTEPGLYAVTLTVFNECGEATALTIPEFIVVDGAPTAAFSANPVTGPAPLMVFFTDESTGDPTTWSWDFGDGATSTEQHPVHEYIDPGTYSVTLTVLNDCGSHSSDPQVIEVTPIDVAADRSFSPSMYASPCEVDVTVTIYNDGLDDISALGVQETIPDGWTFDSVVSPNPPAITPTPGATGTLDFAWFAVPISPVELTYKLIVPDGATGDQCFSGVVLYRRTGGELTAPIGAEECISERTFHSLDYNPADWIISLSELLRLIQFYNFGEYHCEPGSEDGYAPGLGPQDCVPHNSDYNPQDWSINLSELLRAIQFYNFGGYHVECDTEDGYAPGYPGAGKASASGAVKDLDALPSLSAVRSDFDYDRRIGTLDVAMEFMAAESGAITALGLVETLPAGWTFNSLLDGDLPVVAPTTGTSGQLEFAWVVVPVFPTWFTYRVNVPEGSIDAEIGGLVIYRTGGEELETAVALGAAQTFYVDANADGPADGSEAAPFNTIGTAVAETVAGRGDIIIVAPGDYPECITLPPHTTLLSVEGADATQLSGNLGSKPVLTMTDGCVVRGLTIGNPDAEVAIRVAESAVVEIQDCRICSAGTDILVPPSAVVLGDNNNCE